jgi:hypothetical protein
MVSAYEVLRAEVLCGRARPEGLGAVVYHGMIQGLKLLCTSGTSIASPTAPPFGTLPITQDRELLRLLANMVLETQSEITHVY